MNFLGLELELELQLGLSAFIIFQKLHSIRRITIYGSTNEQKLINLN